MAARSPSAKSAKANAQRGKPRDTAAATAGERSARSDAATAARESELATTLAAAGEAGPAASQSEESGRTEAPVESTTATGEAKSSSLAADESAAPGTELPDAEVVPAPPPALRALVSNTASPHKATLVSTGAQP
ncbi:MAG: Pyruvate kinase (EC [uncultured Paraburkholderia sp.]|nr:MAG: Pyruvate kinase (EC [uncultured Paraburkholderia sp.]CAH2780821.1 MAG: Pyruvate kinase (EC [uncultured Paraburkholderia sp.]CAH2914162.1 MAG: Pyruvate kinase (EC [uncultured Paraburkholderia sp.]CAH2916190.1 MAG: Pyruvate kinase (EC [uncultured Paraburkholderia sp.]